MREFVRSTPQEAQDARADFLDARRDGFTIPKGRPPYVGEWARHWLYNVVEGTVERTTFDRSYRQKTEDYIVAYFARTPLPDLDEDGVQAWHAWMRKRISARTGRPLSPSTIGQAHRLLSMCLKVAVIRGKVPRNAAANVRAPAPGEEEAPEPPTDEEVISVLEKCREWRTGARWVTAIATGVRQGEAIGLLWPYVDIEDADDASITVEWELARLAWRHGCEDARACGERYHRFACPPRDCPRIRVSGRPHACVRADDPRLCDPGCAEHARRCPDRAGGLQLKRPKSRRSRRQIPLAPAAAVALRQWRRDQAAEQLAHPAWASWAHDPELCARRLRPRQHVCPDCHLPARPGMVVFSAASGRPTDPRADWQDWSDLQVAAGLPHYRGHDNRHGFATFLLEQGKDIRVVQELMGHADPAFTRSAYQHVRKKLSRDAADAVQRRLTGRG